MRKIGIIGGTFDPIHNGHIKIAGLAQKSLSLDEVFFIPAGNPYLKKNVTPYIHRYNMTKLAIDNYDKFVVSDIEKSEENTYTYFTLQNMHQLYPDSEFYFILGADSLMQIDSWKCPELIFSLCTVLVTVRPGHRTCELQEKIYQLTQKYNANIELFSVEMIDISSTKIRDFIQNGFCITQYVPEEVADYIAQNNLYQGIHDEN